MINTFRSGIQCIDNGTEVDFSSCFEYDSDNDNELLLIDRLQLDENSKKLDKLSQELADVTIYALRLVTVCNVIQPLKESLQQKQQQQS